MDRSDSPRTAWPEKAAILLVAAPVVLFFCTWFQPLVGLPVAAIASWATWKITRDLPMKTLPSRQALLFLAAVAVLWTWTAGLGGLFKQMWDHNFRNALLHDLINHPWPVVWRAGNDTIALDYYLAWSLIPALVGKLLGWKAATLAMAAICAVGVFLIQLIFVRVVGSWRWWIPLILVFWSGLDIVGWGLRRQFPDSLFIENWSLPLWYLSNLINYFCIPHLVIPSGIVTLLLVGQGVGPGRIVALTAFLIPLAPFQLVGIAPFVAWNILQGNASLLTRIRHAVTLENIVVPLVFTAICAPYFLANQGAGASSGWFFDGSAPFPTLLVRYVAFLGIEVLIPAAAIWMTGQRAPLLVLATIVLCLIPLRISGLSNDFALKVSMPGLLVLALFTAKALVASTNGWPRRALIVVLTLGAVTPLHEFWVAARFTRAEAPHFEEDHVRTFDPANTTTLAERERRVLVNFRSHPLDQRPALRWMLGIEGD